MQKYVNESISKIKSDKIRYATKSKILLHNFRNGRHYNYGKREM